MNIRIPFGKNGFGKDVSDPFHVLKSFCDKNGGDSKNLLCILRIESRCQTLIRFTREFFDQKVTSKFKNRVVRIRHLNPIANKAVFQRNLSNTGPCFALRFPSERSIRHLRFNAGGSILVDIVAIFYFLDHCPLGTHFPDFFRD